MKKLIAILLSLTLACAAVLPALAEGKKDETVYVLANPDGSARRVIVSDYLSNPDGADTIADVSNLEKIQNVKGNEAFADGVWQAKGNEIYYQGDSSEALPVELKISATLDGTEIAPADLAGKSGHVTLRFDYAVSASYTKDAETVAVPFAVITGALLSFTMSLDDFVISYFVYGPNFVTLPVEIYNYTKKPLQPKIYALFTLLFLVILVAGSTKGRSKARA